MHVLKHLPLLVLSIITLLGFLIRFYAVAEVPHGLYIDEVSIGNNAYAILTRGVDEHGKRFPLWFAAFGEYKMPVYIYSVAMAMAVLGKSELAVRLPSLLAGTLTIPVVFLLLKELIPGNKKHTFLLVPYIASFLLAITPWHIHFSRGGFEATVALLLCMTALYFFVVFLTTKNYLLFTLCTAFLALTTYTYNSYRLLALLLFCFLLGSAFIKRLDKKSLILFGLIPFLLFLLPLMQFSLSAQGAERFNQISLLNSYKGKPFTEQITKLPIEFLNNYLRYFSLEYLFATGDQNGRHGIPGMGLLYRIELPFLLVGAFALLQRKKDIFFQLVVLLLLLSPLAGAMTIPSPHALRSLSLVIPLTIMVALGIEQVIDTVSKVKMRAFLSLVFVGLFLYELASYLHLYAIHYVRVNSLDWGGAYKETITQANRYTQYSFIAVDKNLRDSSYYITFYGLKKPYEVVEPGWIKPDSLKGKRVLFIRPDYKQPKRAKYIGSVTLPDMNKTIFAEFYSL